MTDTAEILPDRIVNLDPHVVFRLSSVKTAQTEADVFDHKVLYQVLPHQLSNEEVTGLGSRLANLIEAIAPSNDGSRGRRAEVRSLSWLGSSSLLHGDLVSFDNIRQHVKTLGVRGKMAAWLLWYDQKFN